MPQHSAPTGHPDTSSTAARPVHDIVIRGGSVVDGTGAPLRPADIAIDGDLITAVGDVSDTAARTIDASGLVVTPGFIDLHAHADLALINAPERISAISQGVTTEVVGQDGMSYAPVVPAIVDELHGRIRGWNGDLPADGVSWSTVGEFLTRLDGAAVNAAYLAPHATLRMLVMGTEARTATRREISMMSELLDDSLHQGAVGLSAGLTYVPGLFAADDELVELCRTVARHGGYYAPHHRGYGATALQSYADCVDIARRSGVALHLTHAHVSYEVNAGRAGELLALVDGARAEGLDVTLDSYPYTAGSSYLHAFLPSDLQRQAVPQIIDALRQPSVRADLAEALDSRGTVGSQGLPVDWSRVVIGSSSDPAIAGRSVAEIAEERGARAVDTYCDILIADRLDVICLVHEGIEEHVRQIMRHPAHMAGSDGLLTGERPHPRAYGTFARYLGHYVRDEKVIGLEEMVRKMTSAPAERVGLADRGRIAPGAAADIVCLDAGAVVDRAGFDRPRETAAGISTVLVNGALALDDGKPTTVRTGRALTAKRG